jgi:hypothetical protein
MIVQTKYSHYHGEYISTKKLSSYRKEKLASQIEVNLLLSRLTGRPIHELDLAVVKSAINGLSCPVKPIRRYNGKITVRRIK